MKLLLLACGDIGNRVVAGIDIEDWTVAAMRRRAELLPAGVSGFGGDVTDRVQLQQVLGAVAPEVIVVTMTPQAMSDEGYRDSYVKVAENLRQLLAGGYRGLLIWVSSTAVYHQDGGEWVDETSATRPEGFRGKRLLQAEQLLIDSGLPVTVVRFSGIYGPGRERLLRNVQAGRLASPAQPRWSNRIHSDDCAAALLHLLKLYRAGKPLETIYLASDSLPSVDALMQAALAQALGVDVAERGTSVMPAAAGRRCSNKRLLASGFCLRYPSWREGYREMIEGAALRSP